MEEIYKGNFDLACRDYLKHSYLYYIKNDPIVSDSYYDYLCNYLLKNKDKIPEVFLYLVTEDRLRAGTGFDIKESEYPEYIKVES